ncbi:MAG: ABC transporter permease subunit [Alphaproteobacteria bacterium]|nr:ABC transporter permease subunit [Alphaproteobacteria bacterium]
MITLLIWALPGDPASIICPPEVCSGTAELARRWNLDGGPWQFFSGWISAALGGDFGNSWRLLPGSPVGPMLETSIPNTALLVTLAFVPLVLGAIGAATQALPRQLDVAFRGVGLAPAVVLALCAAAIVTIKYGAAAFDPEAMRVKLVLGALALGLADAALAGAVIGVRELVDAERQQRYVRFAVLRGESELANTLPNVLPAIAGQMRARLLHLLSGAVVVEVVLQIDGLGDLLWGGTLAQDFGVVIAAAFGFAVLSAVLLVLQAVVEILVALHVRRAPKGVLA